MPDEVHIVMFVSTRGPFRIITAYVDKAQAEAHCNEMNDVFADGTTYYIVATTTISNAYARMWG